MSRDNGGGDAGISDLDILLRRRRGAKVASSRQPDPQEPSKKRDAPPTTAAANSASDLPLLCVSILKAAKMLDVGRTKVYALINRGDLEKTKIGGSSRVTIRSIEEYVIRNSTVRRDGS
ncbi:MAG: helix-turn-helix domain-containing protein [Sphingobium sp.]|nr:helix-turn-helix domain-containing protein [Sphingobium sp.]